MIKIVNKRNYTGPGIYIGRPSPLGNPFVIGRDGDREEVIRKYREFLKIAIHNATHISPRLVGMMEEENIRVKVLKSGDTEGRAAIIDRWVQNGMDVLITNPKKVEVGMDLLDFPAIIFYQIPEEHLYSKAGFQKVLANSAEKAC